MWQPLQQLSQYGFSFIVITNQAGVGRGMMSMAELDVMHSNMQAKLAEKGVLVKHTYVCPHHPEDSCLCRKPKPGMIIKAIEEYGLNKQKLCLVGDNPTDCQAASHAGIRSMYLGHPEALERLAPDHQPIKIASTLKPLVNEIIGFYTKTILPT